MEWRVNVLNECRLMHNGYADVESIMANCCPMLAHKRNVHLVISLANGWSNKGPAEIQTIAAQNLAHICSKSYGSLYLACINPNYQIANDGPKVCAT